MLHSPAGEASSSTNELTYPILLSQEYLIDAPNSERANEHAKKTFKDWSSQYVDSTATLLTILSANNGEFNKILSKKEGDKILKKDTMCDGG